MRLRVLICSIVVSLIALLSSSLVHVEAAKAKPKPKPGPAAAYPTFHVNDIYVTINRVRLVTEGSDSSNAATHRYLIVFLTIHNGNDVIVRADPGWFTLADALDQPASSVSECDQYLSSVSSEETRLAAAFQPALCHNPYENNSNFVNPGQTVSGSLAFEVPSGQHLAHLTWAPQGAMDGNITWPTKIWTIRY